MANIEESEMDHIERACWDGVSVRDGEMDKTYREKYKIVTDGGQGSLLGGGNWSRDPKGKKAQEKRKGRTSLRERITKATAPYRRHLRKASKECWGIEQPQQVLGQRSFHPAENCGEGCKRHTDLSLGPEYFLFAGFYVQG